MSAAHDYSLVLRDGGRKEFSAPDASQALMLAQAVLPKGRSASLLEDGVPLADISYSPKGFWGASKPSPTLG